jgi:hypothetical protein
MSYQTSTNLLNWMQVRSIVETKAPPLRKREKKKGGSHQDYEKLDVVGIY